MSDNSRRFTISFTKDDEELRQKILEYQEKTGGKNRSRVLLELIEKGLGVDGPKAGSSSYEFDHMSQQLEELRNELHLMAGSLSGLSQERGSVLKAVEGVQEGQRGLETSVGQISESVAELIRQELGSQLQETQSWTRELVSEYGQQFETAWQQNGEANAAQREEAIAKVQNCLAEELSKLEDRIREVLSREQLTGQQEDAGEGVEALISQLRGDLESVWANARKTLESERAEALSRIKESLSEGWAELERRIRELMDERLERVADRFMRQTSILAESMAKDTEGWDGGRRIMVVGGPENEDEDELEEPEDYEDGEEESAKENGLQPCSEDQPWRESFWTSRGRSQDEAEQIVTCFAEYWEERGFGHGSGLAESYLRTSGGKIKKAPEVEWYQRKGPDRYFSPNELPKTDPRYWLRQGCESMEAARRALSEQESASDDPPGNEEENHEESEATGASD